VGGPLGPRAAWRCAGSHGRRALGRGIAGAGGRERRRVGAMAARARGRGRGLGRARRRGTAPRHRAAQGSSSGIGAGGNEPEWAGASAPGPVRPSHAMAGAGAARARHGRRGRAAPTRRGRGAARARGGGGHAGLEKGRGKAGKRGGGAYCVARDEGSVGRAGGCAGRVGIVREGERKRFWGGERDDRRGPRGGRRRRFQPPCVPRTGSGGELGHRGEGQLTRLGRAPGWAARGGGGKRKGFPF
jgi:hypothetical protein